MSHYRVAVVTRNGDIDKVLAPYDENIRVAPYVYRTKQEIIDNLKADLKAAKERAEETKDTVWLESLEENYDWSSDEALYQSYRKLEGGEDEWSAKFDKNGNELSTYNPEAKWDWYMIGGRYDGYILTKAGEMVSEAKVSEIDFDNQLTEEDEAEIIDKWNDAEREAANGDEDFLNELKADYDSKDKEIASRKAFNPYALLVEGKDGKADEWIAPGKVGWFGMTSDTEETYKKYLARIKEVFKSLDPEDIVTVVDCHI